MSDTGNISIQRNRPSSFAPVPHSLTRNSELSSDARFLMILLLGYDASFKMNRKHLMKVCGWGSTKMTKALGELRDFGYLITAPKRGKGGHFIGWIWRLEEDPTELRKSGTPSNGDTENPVDNKKNKPKEKQEEKNNNVHSDLFLADQNLPAKKDDPDLFEEFWNVYPFRGGKKKGKAPAKKAWDRALKKTDPQDIIDGARRYQHDRQAKDGYAKDASTWLNQEGWTDEIEGSGPGRGSGLSRAAANLSARFGEGQDYHESPSSGAPWHHARDVTPDQYDETDHRDYDYPSLLPPSEH